MGQLQAVSDDWLAAKAGAEKGFSLGFFDETYLSRCPVAVIERDGHILAFANLWPGPHHQELSIDLRRYHRDAPRSVMEALLVALMQWGHDQRYGRFALGMAPLAGFEESPVASLWNRLGSCTSTVTPCTISRGCGPTRRSSTRTEPRYLAYPGGLRLPRILADVSALVAGGYRQIFRK
jgi:phosphatidylglycerol lysyltransferase